VLASYCFSITAKAAAEARENGLMNLLWHSNPQPCNGWSSNPAGKAT